MLNVSDVDVLDMVDIIYPNTRMCPMATCSSRAGGLLLNVGNILLNLN